MIVKRLLSLIFILSFYLGNVFADISYQEILQDPENLELNLKFAKEQEQIGNYKSVIATLERLSTIYSENIDLKLYLLSISLKIDSKERTKEILNDIKNNTKLTNDLRDKINQIAKSLEDNQRQDVDDQWTKYIDIGFNYTADNNVNTISNSNTLIYI